MITSLMLAVFGTQPLPSDYVYRCDVQQLLPVRNFAERKGAFLRNNGDMWQFDDAFAKLTGVTEASDDLRDDETMLRGTLPGNMGEEFIAYLDPAVEQQDVYLLDWKVISPATANRDTILHRSGLAKCKFEMFGINQ
jgi:hypothetical protein